VTQLLTIDDLDQPQEVLKPLIEKVHVLWELYNDYIATDAGGYDYNVHVSGEKTRSAGIHASEASGCLRRMVYSIADTERRIGESRDANMLMRFRIGTGVHAMMQNDFHRIAGATGAFTFVDEVEINPRLGGPAKEYGIYSSCDGVFAFSDVRCGLEIKTASPKQFETKLRQPSEEHLDQATIYMACLDLPLMWILYYNKGNSNFTTPHAPFLFRFNKSRWEALEARFIRANFMAEKAQYPEREESMACSWCPFSWICQPNRLMKNIPTSQLMGMGVKK